MEPQGSSAHHRKSIDAMQFAYKAQLSRQSCLSWVAPKCGEQVTGRLLALRVIHRLRSIDTYALVDAPLSAVEQKKIHDMHWRPDDVFKLDTESL